jgi:hypothetical protein
MEEKDGDTWYCYYAVMKLHWRPSDFAFLPNKERAMVIAFIENRLKEEEKERKRLKSSSGGGKRGRRR